MLTVYTLDNHCDWDKIVKSFNNYDVYWLSGYVKAFKIHGDGEPLLIYCQDETTRGINVVMRRDISQDEHFIGKIEPNKYFDFSTPYGYGGWIFEGERVDHLFKEYGQWCLDNNVLSEFVRFQPVIKNHEGLESFYDVVPLGETVTMDLSSQETIWNNLISKNRNMIRKAEKNGITIHRAQDEQIYDVFKVIYEATMDKDNAETYYYFKKEFYDSIRNDLPSNAQVFFAKLEDKVIAASIILSCNGKINYHLSGSVREFSNLAPTNLLLYEVAKWGCENGYKTFYLGGGVGSGEDGLFKFKRSFYKLDDLFRFHIGKKIFNPKAYAELVELREEKPTRQFFPEYRA